MAEPTRTIFGRPLTPALAGAVVRAGAAWIALGGILKLFWGTPFDLPEILHPLMSSDPAGFLALVIGVELIVATLALISPRLGWWGVAAMLAAFTIIAAIETARGSEACGCFGGAIMIPPWLVAVLDLLLLVAVIAVRPWSMLRSGPWRIWSIGPALAGFVIALLIIGEEAAAPRADPVASPPENLAASNTSRPIVPLPENGKRDRIQSVPDEGEGSRNTQAMPPEQGSQTTEAAASGWQLPASMPRFVVMQPDRWVGQSLAQTNLATWADVSKFPADATLIFYMDTCPHCRDLLSEKAMLLSPPDFVLIRVPPPNPNLPIYVKDELPPGLRINLPRGTRWNIQVPWEVVVRGGIVESAEYHGH